MSRGSLDAVRVLEYGTGAGAAYCAALLASIGARVTKVAGPPVEPADADADLRVWARRVALDHAKEIVDCEVGDATFRQRLADAHIVVRGADPIRRGDAETIRTEYSTWRDLRPGIVFVALTPFGVAGPGGSWTGSDVNAQALSGWTWIVGNPGEAPLSMNYDIGALQQGLGGAGAALAALLETGPTVGDGGGDFVDISEADILGADIRMYGLTYQFLGITMTRSGRRAPGSAGRYPATALPCKDGLVNVICRSAVDWQRLIEMIGNPGWAALPRYQDLWKAGTEYPEELDALIIPWTMRYTRAELSEMALRHRVPLASVATIDEVLANPQFAYRGFFETVPADGREVRVPGAVAHVQRAGDSTL